MDNLMKASGIYAIYEGKEGANNVVALRNINLEIKKGEFISVVGPSGSGKSSLLRIIGGLQYPSAGKIMYGDSDITKLSEDELVPFRRNTMGFIFQTPNLINSYTALENVINTLRYTGKSASVAKKRAIDILTELGMRSRMQAYPTKLSGGERQRVGIARALANHPQLVLADEPTGNVDHKNTENIMGIFSDLHQDLDTAFFVVTHSQFVSRYANRTLEILDGRFSVEHGHEVNIFDLESTREVIINGDGTLALPPEIYQDLKQFGSNWRFKIHYSNGTPEIRAKPVMNPQNVSRKCPLCGAMVNSSMFNCRKCGVELSK